MFSGIIESIGTVQSVARSSDGLLMRFSPNSASGKDVQLGDSIAVNGVCLTVTSYEAENVQVFISNETLARSRFGTMCEHSLVNIEHPLTVSKGLSGHVVTGHVDGLAKCTEVKPDGASTLLAFLIEEHNGLGEFIAEKGSIAIDGVSMTVNRVTDLEAGTEFTVNLIPYTQTATTLGDVKVEQFVHIEVDILARYAKRAIDKSMGRFEPTLSQREDN